MLLRAGIANGLGRRQNGFSLVELMVGLFIGLIASIVIMQVFADFEGKKRTTTGSSDAQVNGSIALYTMQRDIQNAGFGLPVFDTQNPPLKCNPTVTIDHDSNPSTSSIDIFPIQIIDGAISDTIRVRFSTDGATSKGGMTTEIKAKSGVDIGVNNNLNCKNGDVVIISDDSACAMTKVNDTDLATDTTHITVYNAAVANIGASLACMGSWNQFTYTINDNKLERNSASSTTPTPMVSDIVNIQAQYGISAAANDNDVAEWVSATNTWVTPSVANRNRIKAVHIAVVARNGQYEKEEVTTVAPTAWAAVGTSTTPTIDLSSNSDWKHYRYKVYETIVPLRNMIWSKNTL